MIYQYKIQTLTGAELGLLLYICNEVFTTNVRVDEQTITAYKHEALAAKLRAAKKRIKPEYFEFYEIMCAKLDIDV